MDQDSVTIGEVTVEKDSALSKVLFPDSHTDKVSFCGKQRTLKPVPIKIARQIHELLKPFNKVIQEAVEKQESVDAELDLVATLLDVVKLLAAYYGWDDAKEALDAEEVTVAELQQVVVTQQNLQGANDFLLSGLRILVAVMKQAEIGNLSLLMSTSSGPR